MKKGNIGNKLNVEDESEYNRALNHYVDSFYLKVKELNTFLTDEELKELANEFIKKTILTVESNNTDFRVVMNVRISNEIKLYKNDKTKIEKRYVMLLGPNKRMAKYYYNEYKDLLEYYKDKKNYDYLSEKFEDIVVNAISRNKKVFGNYRSIVEKELRHFNKKINLDSNEEVLLIRNKKISEEQLNYNYLYLKNRVYKKYDKKLNLEDDVFNFLVNRKYNSYVKAYVNGTSKTAVREYLNTRLNEHFKKYKPLTKESLNLINLTYFEYHNLIEEVLVNINANYPKKTINDYLEVIFLEYIYEYYLIGRTSDVSKYIKLRLKEQIDFLDNCYVDDNLEDYYKVKEAENIIKKIRK